MTWRLGVSRAAIALAGLAAAWPGGAVAQGMRWAPPSALRPGIGSEDPRRMVDPAGDPWRALGRVQTEIGGRCTGVLVGPRTVLTAAHCLIARRAEAMLQPGSVHFLLGYHLGRYAAHARVVAYTTGPGFRPSPIGPAGADWALLTLERPVGGEGLALPLLREPPRPRTPLMLGGYQKDRPEALLADTGCRALGMERRQTGHPMLVHDCAGTHGVSGAPLLARGPDGRWGVAGVASIGSPDIALGHAVPTVSVGPLP
jgi:protease YdgD